MPSKKPIIHFNTDQWIIDKMKYIAEEHSRSLAKEVEYLCKQQIKAFEEEHGEITIAERPTRKKAFEAEKQIIKERHIQPAGKAMKETWKNGFNFGNVTK